MMQTNKELRCLMSLRRLQTSACERHPQSSGSSLIPTLDVEPFHLVETSVSIALPVDFRQRRS
jgi:hypothetical protein